MLLAAARVRRYFSLVMMKKDEQPGDSNWLDMRKIRCQSCEKILTWVLWSPFNDGHIFYCSRCPRRLEVSYYDKFYKSLQEQVGRSGDGDEADFLNAIHLVEQYLRACSCGGEFRYEAKRRCVHCHTVVCDDASRDEPVAWREVWSDSNWELDKNLVVDGSPWK